MKNWQRETRYPEREKRGEEDRECDVRTALRQTWNEWEKNG